MLRLPRFRMEVPRTADEAAALLRDLGAGQEDPAAVGTQALRVMAVAGGTDLYPNMKRRQFTPEVLVSLRRALGREIAVGRTETTIGAGATLTVVASHPAVRDRYRALAIAAGLVSTPQLRNMGTIGGNVCLDTRCNWYNESLFWRTAEGFCMKTHPSVVCRVATSSPRCLAVASADTVPALMALGAFVRVRSAGARRDVQLEHLYQEDGIRFLTIARDEIVTEVVLPLADGWRSTYLKARDRGSFDFPIVGLAAAVRMDGATVADARVALTAVASRPVLVDAARAALVGSRLDDDAIAAAAEAAFKAARPMDNTSGTIAQRKRTVSVFATRALRELRDGAAATAAVVPALAVVPAAGAAERFGSEKLSAKVGDVLLLERTIRSLLDGGVERIVVVLPPGAGLLRDIVNGVGETEVRVATNRRPERGMFSSIQEGLKEVTGDPILVLPADMPFVEPGTIHLLLVRQREAGGIVSPRFEGKRGHPVVFPRALRDEIVSASDGTTLHDVLKAHASERVDVDVYDRGVIRDVDEPKDLEEPAP